MINNIRVWDKEKKTMKGVQLCVNGGVVEDLDRYKIMMSNMAVDKNGKLIFEGDIVKFTNSEDEESCIFGIVKLEGGQFIVEQLTVNYYVKNGYKILNSFYEYDDTAVFSWEQLQVVGNIYSDSKLYRRLLNRKKRMPKRKTNSSVCKKIKKIKKNRKDKKK
jgi:uncharacterized phage protein (TIGR01671 family)